jgi:biotin transport system substrate-specific component
MVQPKWISFSQEKLNTQSTVISQTMGITFFTLLTAIGAQITIPHSPVPYTLQTFFVLLSAALLGYRNGSISQILYLIIGACGAPVFTGGASGFVRLLGPTGGYLLSFPLAAIIIGYGIRIYKSYLWSLFIMTIGLCVIFGIGTLFLNVFYIHDSKQSIIQGFLIFSWWDLLKLFAAAAIYNEFTAERTKTKKLSS